MSHRLADVELGEYFDRCARDGVMSDFSREEVAQLERLADEWAIAPGERVLEPGCGAGRLTERLAAAVGPGGWVLACDLSELMLDRARRRGLPPQVRLHHGSAAAVPAPDASFDLVVCLNVLPHFHGLGAVLAELRRVLAPGGRLWVNHFASRDAVNAFHARLDGPVRTHRLPTPDELWAAMVAAGLEPELVADGAAGFRARARRR